MNNAQPTSPAVPPTAAPANAGAVSADEQSSRAVPIPPARATSTEPSLTPPYFAYTVKPGDTLRFIASTYGVSAASIASASGLTNADRLRVGQVLTIPSQPGWLYRLQPGETLEQVAARVGLAPETIEIASGIPHDRSPRAGDVLLIPLVPTSGAK